MSKLVLTCVALAVVLTSPASTQAQDPVKPVVWSGDDMTTDWGTNPNWSTYDGGPLTPFVPESQYGETAVINNGDLVEVNGTYNSGTSPQGPARLQLASGTLSILNSSELSLGVGVAEPASELAEISSRLNLIGTGEFNAGDIVFGSAATLDIDLSPSTTSPVTASGNVTLNGALELDFTGGSPGGALTLISGGAINGSFADVSVTGLGAAQNISLVTSPTAVTANVVNLPTLVIDRDTGAATFKNTHGSSISLDGFSIRSPLGGLDETQFTGLARSGWDPAGGNSSTVAADTFEGPNAGTPSDSVPASFMGQLGGAGFWTLPQPQAFLQETEEVVFEFTDEGFDGALQGVVEYTGARTVNNNIVLYIDNAGANKGSAAMLNESIFAQGVEVYRISSTGDPLQVGTWNPLEGQVGAIDNATWQVSTQSGTGALIEVTESGSSNFDQFTRYDIGQILTSGFTQESGITFEFLLEGDSSFTTGEVMFVDEIPMADTGISPGDFNGDSAVDAIDYAVWREAFQSGSALPFNGSDTIAVPGDFDVWLANYGANYGPAPGPTPAPEPSAAVLLASCIAATAGRRVHRNAARR